MTDTRRPAGGRKGARERCRRGEDRIDGGKLRSKQSVGAPADPSAAVVGGGDGARSWARVHTTQLLARVLGRGFEPSTFRFSSLIWIRKTETGGKAQRNTRRRDCHNTGQETRATDHDATTCYKSLHPCRILGKFSRSIDFCSSGGNFRLQMASNK